MTQNTRTRKKSSLTVALVLVLAAVLLAGLFVLLPGKAAVPFAPQGAAAAARTQPPPEGAAGEALQQWADEAVASAQAAGLNTLLFEAHPGNQVYYQSPVFASYPGGEDPLALLCRTANAKQIAVYILVAPYTAGVGSMHPTKLTFTPPEYAKGSPATTATLLTLGDIQYFDPADKSYAKLLVKDLAYLAQNYPAAGILIQDPSAVSPSVEELTQLAAAITHANAKTTAGLCDFNELSGRRKDLPALVSGGFSLLVPRIESEDGSLYADCLAAKAGAVWPDTLSTLGGEERYYALATANKLPGAVFGTLGSNARHIGAMVTALGNPLNAESLPVPGNLQIGTPTPESTTTRENCLILGTSDPAQPLLLNGSEVARTTKNGSFAVFVPLAMGDNSFTLTQGETTAALTVTRNAPEPGTGGKTPTPDTALNTELAGRTIQITGQIASALSDPKSDGAISMTLKEGMTATVQGTVETLRSGKIVKAYLLESGDYLLARNADLLDAPLPAPALSVTGTTQSDRLLTVQLEGGSPLCYPSRTENSLVLDFYGASLGDIAPLTTLPEQIASATAEKTEKGARLTLQFAPQFAFWGYDLACTDTGMTLRITSAPALGSDPLKPLAGVKVLLDAGHGGTDFGAAGITGLVGGACEKDVNLALAQVLRQRLEQLGATVTMTRTDDSFPTLQDRYALGGEQLPDYFLALHHNSIEFVKDTNTVNGIECYYFEQESLPLAQNLLSAVSVSTGRRAAAADTAYFYVCRQTAFRSVLFEFGYLVNPAENESCFSAAGLRSAAVGITNGLMADLGVFEPLA